MKKISQHRAFVLTFFSIVQTNPSVPILFIGLQKSPFAFSHHDLIHNREDSFSCIFSNFGIGCPRSFTDIQIIDLYPNQIACLFYSCLIKASQIVFPDDGTDALHIIRAGRIATCLDDLDCFLIICASLQFCITLLLSIYRAKQIG